MSTTTTIPPIGGRNGDGEGPVARYVAAVRAELDDLGPDEIEELTDGLEADLADALAGDNGSPTDRFGPPAAYATELRAAAGLGPRDTSGRHRAGIVERARSWYGSTEQFRQHPFAQAAADYVVTLRPAWWIVRAWAVVVLGQMVDGGGYVVMSPRSAPWWLLFAVLAVGSVMLGRRTLRPVDGRAHLLLVVGNTLAVVVLLVAMVQGSGPRYQSYSYDSGSEIGNDLYNNGYQVTNIFPYDRNGKPLSDVQLYDDRGRPLQSDEHTYEDRNFQQVGMVPGVATDGTQRWNSYPLNERYLKGDTDSVSGAELTQDGPVHEANRPDPQVTPLVTLPTPSPSPSPSPSSSPSPS